ncbi:MAG: cytochrome P450 [Spongiibacteraceae bacterium]
MSDLEIPSHVPAHLVRHDYPFTMGMITAKNPFEEILPEFLEDEAIIYATTAYPIGMSSWIPKRLKDIQAVYLDEENFSSENLSPFPMLSGGNWKVTPIEIDPPQHMGYRKFLNPLFTPKNLSALDDKVRQTARDLIAKFKDKGECEFMDEFSMKFPIAVFLDLMGFPQERMAQFLEWEHMLLHSIELEGIAKGTQEVIAYLEEVIEDRRKNPGDDIVSQALQYEIDGEKLNDNELLGLCFNLYIGGLDTVTTNISWQIRHLAEHLEDQRALRGDPSLISTALENLYRRYASVTTFRTCIKPVEVAGVKIMPGDKVSVSTTYANNDPTHWGNPAEMELSKAPRHVTFGYGVHRCVGAALARRESIVAIEELFAALPEFKIKEGAELKTALGTIWQPINMPLEWEVGE